MKTFVLLWNSRLVAKLSIILILLSPPTLRAQENPLTPWQGNWAGKLEIHNTEGLVQIIAMQLNVAQLTDSSWTWQIVYGEGDEREERNYELLATQQPGNYLIDEKNSIKLDLNLIKNGFFSFFQVGKSKLLISYELVNGEVHFRSHSADTDTETKTGGEDDAPLVYTWKTGSYQIAVLRRN